MARPPSGLYRFRRMVKRNKLAFAAGAAVFFAVLTGAVISVWQGVRARHEARRAGAAELRAVDALSRLTATAPSFYEQAQLLIENGALPSALEKIDLALTLQPGKASFHKQRGHILQSLERFAESVDSYTEALRLDPHDPSAAANRELSCRFYEAKVKDGVLSMPARRTWRDALIVEGRNAEAIAAGRSLAADVQAMLPAWQSKIDAWLGKEAPRLTVDRSFRLYVLDLSDRSLTDLAPLRGMLLGILKVNRNSHLTDLDPLTECPLRISCKRFKGSH
jgi:tetratricopeptide (TPR) repeat protein